MICSGVMWSASTGVWRGAEGVDAGRVDGEKGLQDQGVLAGGRGDGIRDSVLPD